MKISCSKLTSISETILEPTWLHFPSQNRSKSRKNRFWKASIFWLIFCIDFLSILAPSWDPSWGHVGHDFGLKGPPGRPGAGPYLHLFQNHVMFPPRFPPDPLQTSILTDFWSIFWSIFDWFSIYFALIFLCFLLNVSLIFRWI